MSAAGDLERAKAALRATLSAARRRLTEADVATARAAVRTHVLDRVDSHLRGRNSWHRVLAYEPLRTEPGSTELLDALTERGLAVFVPVRLPDNDLDWLHWPDRTSAPRAEVEPAASALLVPALAVDRHGHRIGRGGGSYDRVLARIAAGVPVIALLHRGEVVDRVPTEPWDRPVTGAVTPQGWIDLPGSTSS